MKRLTVFLAFAMLAFTELALAQVAVATAVTGTVQVQTGSAPVRPVRLGDELRQGDTVSTGPTSSVVLKFDDGQVAALTANSRMTISAYQYNPQARSGNILLSLVTGGMRAITGIIGRNQPERVAYRAATATIGIRGTSTTLVTDGTNVAATVEEGSVTFSFGGQTIVIPAGQGVLLKDGRLTTGTIQQIYDQMLPNLREYFGSMDSLAAAIDAALVVISVGTTTSVTPSSVPPGGGGVSTQ